jgi:hypothetical protein
MADYHWLTCSVNAVGPTESGEIMFQLKDLGDSPTWKDWRWFMAAETLKREILSVDLSALAAGLRVYVDLKSPDEESRINRLYMVRAP